MRIRRSHVIAICLIALLSYTRQAQAQVLATIASPANGATNVDPAAGFSWNSVSDAQAYYLYVGSAEGLNDVYNSGSLSPTVTSISRVPGLQPNTTYFIRLWTEINGVWGKTDYVDSSFTTGFGTLAHLTQPANGAVNVSLTAPITWNSVPNAQGYYLYIGTSVGAKDVWSYYTVQGTSVVPQNLANGRLYYARIWTEENNAWYYVDSTFSTSNGSGGSTMAYLTAPLPGATNVDPYQAFAWNPVSGAQAYYIYVGSSPGATDIFNSGPLIPSNTSWIPAGLLGGQTYYIKFWTELNNTWYANSSSFSTAPQPLPSDASTFRNTVLQQTGNIRLMTQGISNTPQPGTLLAQQVAADGNPKAYCKDYARALVAALAGQRITARIRTISFDGPVADDHVITEYYDPFLNYWFVADPTFGVVYWSQSTATGMSVSDLSSAVIAKNWSSITPVITYATNNSETYAHDYYMDPILIYLNPSPPGDLNPAPLTNSPVPYLTVHPASDVGKWATWMFSFQKKTDAVTISDPVLGVITLAPLGGTSYSQAVILETGWSVKSAPSGLQMLTINHYVYF